MTRPALCLAFCMLATPSLADSAAGGDWPQWQGPNRDAASAATGLLQEWPEGGPKLAWQVEELGGGDSAPAIADGRLYGMSNRGDEEVVWALNESDGSPLWASPLGPAFDQRFPQSKEGPGCTPTVNGDRLYVIGMGGTVACLRAADGEVLWRRSMTEEFGGVVPAWSYRESPLVDGGRVICTPGGKDATIAALDKLTGETIWTTVVPEAEKPAGDGDEQEGGRRRRRGFDLGPPSGAAYSSPIAIDFDGRRQYLQFTGLALVGVDAEDGRLLWRYDHPANAMRINCSTPIFHDGLAFAASAYGTGGGAVRLSPDGQGGVEAEEVYFSSNMQNHHGGMLVIDNALYGANGGNGGGFLACLDFPSGELLWRDRDAPKGALLYADRRIYLRSEDGEVLLIEPNRDELITHGRFEQPQRTDKPAWAHPVVANGRLYIRDQGLLLCYDVSAAASGG
ncbi:outer membrane biogenesis protein BamB [Posidoniimonas corsicana]|uniref:Outer membrane biogenesis protein BamB n=1 Tax=Posidoniimonas corsicana TaxID=1938618 RepID=A0A5C5V725_9BACT|nr:PQQ-binding-like beta-propeller repeat protein [Posidoniimonas corsicana]TWT33532.1 outer membrane biogenesis protein BamB [Posidoniimonas corsicana]